MGIRYIREHIISERGGPVGALLPLHPPAGTIEPIFDACQQHPDLVRVWVYDLLWDMGFVQQ